MAVERVERIVVASVDVTDDCEVVLMQSAATVAYTWLEAQQLGEELVQASREMARAAAEAAEMESGLPAPGCRAWLRHDDGVAYVHEVSDDRQSVVVSWLPDPRDEERWDSGEWMQKRHTFPASDFRFDAFPEGSRLRPAVPRAGVFEAMGIEPTPKFPSIRTEGE